MILGYIEAGPNLVTLAMNGWGEGEPAWWLNLQAHPQARVQLTDGTHPPTTGRTETASWITSGRSVSLADREILHFMQRGTASAPVQGLHRRRCSRSHSIWSIADAPPHGVGSVSGRG